MTIQHQCFLEDLEGYEDRYFTSSGKGWISNEIYLEWLKKIFILLTKSEEPQSWFFIVKCHGGNETIDFMWEY